MKRVHNRPVAIMMPWKDINRAKILASQGQIVVLTHPVSLATLKTKKITKIICSDIQKLKALAQLMNSKKLVAGLKIHQDPIPHYDLGRIAEERFFREAKKAGIV